MRKTHYYKGYAIHKPEGCEYWNVHFITSKGIDWCYSCCHTKTIKEAKISIDYYLNSEQK